MSDKSVLFIIAGIVLIVFLQNLSTVAVEFIKSTERTEQAAFPQMFMMPMPEQQTQKFRNDIAGQ